MMTPKFCFWSVCDGKYGEMMERCVQTARQAGVFKEFHVLSDRPLAGCKCYDAFQCDKSDGMFKLNYCKVGMSRLNFDYFVWLDADTVFTRNPVDLFGALSRSPIHVPLEVNVSAMRQDREWKGVSCFKTRELFRQAGVANEAYLSGSAFWIIHRDAIDQVYELAFRFFNLAREVGLRLGADAALGYAMQMLCANPEAHTVAAHPDVWVNNYLGPLDTDFPRCERWQWRHPLLDKPLTVRPAIVHLGATARDIPVETVSSEHQALP